MTGPTGPFSALGQFKTSTGKFGPSCTGTTMGSCCYETAAAGELSYISAGTLTVSDGATTLATLTPPPAPVPALYEESSLTVPGFTWAPGDTLTVAGSGATVDAFTVSVVAPAVLAGTKPSFAAPIPVSLSADYVVSWNPSSETCSQVQFGLSQTGAVATPYITCVVDDAEGTLTVPKALLQNFTATTGMAVMERIETKETLAANAAVGVVASEATTADTTYTP